MFQNYRRFLICFLFVFANWSLYAQYFSKNDLKADLYFVDSMFAFGHPMHLLPEWTFESKPYIDRTLDQLPDTISKNTYENAVRELILATYCAHTNVEKWTEKTPKKEIPKRFFPFITFSDSERLWIVEPINDSVKSELTRGDEILEINGHKIDSVLSILNNYHPQDGKGTHFIREIICKNFPLLFAKCIDKDSSYQVTYKNKEGKIQRTQVEGRKLEKTNVDKEVSAVASKEAFLSFVRDTVAYLRIRSIETKTKKFHKKIFERLSAEKSPYLILDLRDNLGGNLYSSIRLISYLTKEESSFSILFPNHNLRPFMSKKYRRKNKSHLFRLRINRNYHFQKTNSSKQYTYRIKPNEKAFTGKVYILVNGLTASGASFVTSYARHHGNAVVIGQPTGGGEFWNGAGSYPILKLPKSGLLLKSSTTLMRYDMPANHFNGISPDYFVEYSWQNFGLQDLEMEKVFDLLESK